MDLKSSGSKLNAICILNYLHHKNAGLLIGQELNGSLGCREVNACSRGECWHRGGLGRCLHCTLFPSPRGGMEMDKTCQMSRLPGEILV